VNADNKALHRTTIPLRSKIAGELGVILKGRKGSTTEDQPHPAISGRT